MTVQSVKSDDLSCHLIRTLIAGDGIIIARTRSSNLSKPRFHLEEKCRINISATTVTVSQWLTRNQKSSCMKLPN